MRYQLLVNPCTQSENRGVTAQLEAELARHQNGQGDLATHKKNWDDAKAALAGHQKTHDHHAG